MLWMSQRQKIGWLPGIFIESLIVNCPISVGAIFFKLTYPPPLEVNAYVVMHFNNMAYKTSQINALSQKKLLPRGGKWKCRNPGPYNRLLVNSSLCFNTFDSMFYHRKYGYWLALWLFRDTIRVHLANLYGNTITRLRQF